MPPRRALAMLASLAVAIAGCAAPAEDADAATGPPGLEDMVLLGSASATTFAFSGTGMHAVGLRSPEAFDVGMEVRLPAEIPASDTPHHVVAYAYEAGPSGWPRGEALEYVHWDVPGGAGLAHDGSAHAASLWVPRDRLVVLLVSASVPGVEVDLVPVRSGPEGEGQRHERPLGKGDGHGVTYSVTRETLERGMGGEYRWANDFNDRPLDRAGWVHVGSWVGVERDGVTLGEKRAWTFNYRLASDAGETAGSSAGGDDRPVAGAPFPGPDSPTAVMVSDLLADGGTVTAVQEGSLSGSGTYRVDIGVGFLVIPLPTPRTEP